MNIWSFMNWKWLSGHNCCELITWSRSINRINLSVFLSLKIIYLTILFKGLCAILYVWEVNLSSKEIHNRHICAFPLHAQISLCNPCNMFLYSPFLGEILHFRFVWANIKPMQAFRVLNTDSKALLVTFMEDSSIP